jgi:hypothetical protein
MEKQRMLEEPKPVRQRPVHEEQETQDAERTQTGSSGVAELHRHIGNQAVQRLLAQRNGDGPTELDDETAGRIDSARGGGRPLDAAVGEQMSQAMGVNLGGVSIHTSPEADTLNQQLGAKAFTTGQDIFFRSGAYDPHSSAGQELIAHELTHVVQQCSPQRRSSPPSWTKPETAVSKTGGAQVMRWTQSGDEATVERPLDTLWELARGITDQPRNWACIWPEDIHTPSLFTGQYWRRLQVGDTYDTSNLYNQTGPSETFTFYVRGDPFTETAQYLYGGTRPVNLYQEIGALSRWGGTPIQSLTVCGHTAAHSLLARGAQLGLGLNPEHPRPTSNSALARMGPHRGWFTRNAVVRFVGCTTRHLAAAFARVFLRRGAVALGTTKALCSGEGLLPVELPHTGPMSEAKYSRRRFMFVVPPSGSCADVNQAREILDTKEKVNAAAGLWETIPGQL